MSQKLRTTLSHCM